MKKSFTKWSRMLLVFISIHSSYTIISCKDEKEDPAQNPIASFQYAISAANSLEVTFTNYSQNATSYEWNFGDGQTSTEVNPVHTYIVAGNYTVVLTAKNAANTNITYTIVSCKDDDEVPIAGFRFAISPTNFLRVTFSNSSQNATFYEWNFGDGQTSTEANPVHIYEAAGNYLVVLTAKNAADSTATLNQTIEITDPNPALGLLAGVTSKTWKLFREGTCMGVGPSAENARIWWSLDNSGIRPCMYYHEFTFNRDDSFVFDDKGFFWGESGMFGETPVAGICFEAIASNMINNYGTDVSALLSGTHTYSYNPAINEVTITGVGAWMGLITLTETGETSDVPASRKFKITIEERTGYDLMTLSYSWDAVYWDFTYASYSNPSLEPAVVEN
ncbi:MAG: PKD domain-containing protein [Bacteroidota bacterium]